MRTAHALAALVTLVLSSLLPGGCKPKETGTIMEQVPEKDYERPLPPGQLALRKLTDPRDIPDFTQACENRAALATAIDHSLRYLSKPSSRKYFPYGQITHDHAYASLKAFKDLLESNPGAPGQLNAAIREKFDVYISVGCDEQGTVLFTSYYTPILDASPVRTEKFRHPLLKKPDNLVKDEEGRTLGLKQPDGRLARVPSRQEIDAGNLFAGGELYWLADRFEVFIAHVQGSAKLRMPDGQIITVGYTASNGHEYHSVGKELVKSGKIAKGKLSLQAMIDYFKAHPNEMDACLSMNPRYVFFAPSDGGPFGSLNEPVIPYRSIATDKEVYPRACLAFVSAKLPQRTSGGIEELPYRSFALDQDTGGAIRAPGRCDLYVGTGQQAGELAGRTYVEGRLYYLFLKPTLLTPSVLPPMTQPVK
jgi:membrane-bound lytic murein transglycosylase A